MNPLLASLHSFLTFKNGPWDPGLWVPLSWALTHHPASLLPADTGLCQSILRLGTFRTLRVCAEFVHVIERLCEESPAGVDLHQGPVTQPGMCLLLPHKAASRHRSLAWECHTCPWSALGSCLKHDVIKVWSVRAMHTGKSFFYSSMIPNLPQLLPIYPLCRKKQKTLQSLFQVNHHLRGTCTCKPGLKGPLPPSHEVDISRLKFGIMITSSFSTRNSTSVKFMVAQASGPSAS